MEEKTQLRYFIAKFGFHYFFENPLESRCYPLSRKYWPSEWSPYTAIREGDLVLLYCFQNYPGHSDEIPGLGIIYRIDKGDERNTLWYHYLPLVSPIDGNTITSRLMRADLQEDLDGILHAGRSPYRFLFMIKRESARALLEGCQVNWP